MSESTGDILSAFRPFDEKLRAAGSHPLVTGMFKRNFLQLLSGSTGAISRSQIDPVDAVPDAEDLTGYGEQGKGTLGRAARSLAADSPSAPTADAATSWRWSRQPVRCTRPARSPAIRWP